MISVKQLTKIYRSPIHEGNFFANLFNRRYKEHTALDSVSFSIDANELVGLIGPNGAGKTTTMKILSGILYPTAGKVKVLGYTPFEKNPEFLKRIGFVMGQKNQLLWELPATDAYDLNKEIYEIDDRTFRKTKDELIELLDAKDFIDQPVKTLSLGQRMRAELIGALLHKPKILFLDEPTIGLDIFAQTTIIKFIKEYQEQYKSTILLTSHYMQDVERLAKRIVMIDKGHIIFDGKLEELVQKFSQEKTVRVTLSNKVVTYKIPKSQLSDRLPLLLKELDYIDVSIEDEPIEEIIKKTFRSIASQNTK